MPDLKIVFAGTPAFAARHLQALLAAGHTPVAVYTQPDRSAGRGKTLQASPVKQLAQSHNLPVFQPVSLKTPEAQAELAALQPDLMIVVAYGLLLPKAVLDIPRFGCINVHASLLPRWRGAAPIERALMAGDAETGVTIMQMDVGLDTGDMLFKVQTPISDTDDRQTLEDRLAELGCDALIKTLADLQSLQANAEKQDDSLTTYARKIEKAEALINWQGPAAEIDRLIRSSIGRNPAYSLLQGQRIRILKAQPVSLSKNAEPGTIVEVSRGNANSPAAIVIACGEGAIAATQLQLPGKNPANVRELLNAYSSLFAPGARFSDQEAS
ncbi:MAG TPA: methionyl-tRNA formyltransferase [Pseudohongiella sp.]|nr:methionyl-tRNA formyltransferase [Pseudohongiella sp.]